uniref:G-protein coupled receptors family 1 profile domain-containing protein n=1 Tax=Oryzias sinensis TaxID=183150 RepID=A0A8C7WUW0_9TELE
MSLCTFSLIFFYSFGGSEFFLLAVMSYDRYVSICKPLQYAIIMKKIKAIVFVGLAWGVPVCHLVVPAIQNSKKELCSFKLTGIFCNSSLNDLFCAGLGEPKISGFIILFNVVILPMLFIIFTYAKILIVVYKSSRKVRGKAAQTCLPHLLVLINYSCLAIY